jgi:hypothetical protein
VKILVIGQLPPPVHGANIMAERFMNALQHNGFKARIVQKTFSRTMDEVGKVSLSKMMRVPSHCSHLIRTIREFKPNICIYFITVGITALTIDALLIELLIKHKVPYILYFHGKGYQSMP